MSIFAIFDYLFCYPYEEDKKENADSSPKETEYQYNCHLCDAENRFKTQLKGSFALSCKRCGYDNNVKVE